MSRLGRSTLHWNGLREPGLGCPDGSGSAAELETGLLGAETSSVTPPEPMSLWLMTSENRPSTVRCLNWKDRGIKNHIHRSLYDQLL
jgi:hypothetical protein